MTRTVLFACARATAFVLCAAGAHAQAYPSKPITIIVPFTAGGGGDVGARIIAPAMSKALGQSVVIDNITGGGGTIGSRRAATAAPDGYTLIMASPGTHAGAPALYANLGYEPVAGHEPIGLVSTTPIVLVAKNQIPAKTLQEFISYLRANEKTVTAAHAGIGSMSHLACSLFNSLVGVKPTEVPYRGMPPLMQDMLGGRVDYTCNQANGILGLIGRIKVFVVADDRPAPSLPGVPTATEAGLPEFKVTVWLALAAPKGTPSSITLALNRALAAAFDDPIVQKRYTELGLDIPPREERSPAWLRSFMQSEMERWTTVLRKAGVKPEQ
jgi:putative tricarboxylic transport membrane protein